MPFRKSLFIILALLMGCQKSSQEPTVEEQNQRALTLLEKNQVDEAIALLTDEDRARPHERTKVLLASAYAKKAGLEIKDYWGFTVGYQDFVEDTKIIGKEGLESIFGTQLTPVVQKELEKQNLSAADLHEILGRLSKIPEKNYDQTQLLMKARDILKKTESGGARLYRAIIGVVILKFSIQRVVEYIPKAAFDRSAKCPNSWNSVAEWFQFSLESIDEVLKDILVGFPSQEKSIQETSAKIQNLLQELPEKKTELTGQLCPKK